jgi:NAD-dependent deacetylase
MFFGNKLARARSLIANAQQILILSGAGLSAGSGLPTFSGVGSDPWKTLNALRYTKPGTFLTDPVGMWEAHEAFRHTINELGPNDAHRAIALLKATKAVRHFTHNVDGYHLRAGDAAYEMHGTIHALRCYGCSRTFPLESGKRSNRPECPSCHQPLRHDVVLEGEEVRYLTELENALEETDLMILVGTSGIVTETRAVASYLNERGVSLLEINPAFFTPTLWSRAIRLRARAEDVLPQLVA